MTTKGTDLTHPDELPLPTAGRADARRRSMIVDGATSEVATQMSPSPPDVPTGTRVERASGGVPGAPSRSEGRRLTRAEGRRAYLDAIRSKKRGSGRKDVDRRAEASSILSGKDAMVIADVVAEGYIKPKSGRTKHRHPPRPVVRLAERTSVDGPALEPTLSQGGRRSAVFDFEAEADRLSLPLGTAPSDEVALQRLKVVAADAKDIFPNADAAIEFLTTRPLDGRGRNGIEILRQKGLPGIISSLDQRRFGYSG